MYDVHAFAGVSASVNRMKIPGRQDFLDSAPKIELEKHIKTLGSSGGIVDEENWRAAPFPPVPPPLSFPPLRPQHPHPHAFHFKSIRPTARA